MSFYRYDENGNVIRNRVITTCDDESLTEQSHVKETDVNQIVKRHGKDLIQKANELMSTNFQMDNIPGNDFHESMMIIQKASKSFSQMPSQVRKQFDNDPAKFLDFVQNPANAEAMVTMGLAIAAEPVSAEPTTQQATTEPATSTTTETPTV
jgi:hypothetical protein